MPRLDTTPDARRVHLEAVRSLGLEGRARVTFELSDDLSEISRAGIRTRHPDYSDSEVIRAQLRMQLEPDLFRAVFPDGPTAPR